MYWRDTPFWPCVTKAFEKCDKLQTTSKNKTPTQYVPSGFPLADVVFPPVSTSTHLFSVLSYSNVSGSKIVAFPKSKRPRQRQIADMFYGICIHSKHRLSFAWWQLEGCHGCNGMAGVCFDIDTNISARNVIKLIWHYLLCRWRLMAFCVRRHPRPKWVSSRSRSTPSRCFLDYLMKRKSPHVIQYACCRHFIKIRKLWRQISDQIYRSSSRMLKRYSNTSADKNMFDAAFRNRCCFEGQKIMLFGNQSIPAKRHSIALLSFSLFIIITAFSMHSHQVTVYWITITQPKQRMAQADILQPNALLRHIPQCFRSSTWAISYDCHSITIQYCHLSGNIWPMTDWSLGNWWKSKEEVRYCHFSM